MKRLRKQTAFVIAVIIALTVSMPIAAGAISVGGQEVSSQGACIIDFDTGIVLFGHEADVLRVPASMTKLLAVYVIYDAVREGEISLDTVTTISKDVSDFSYSWEYSNVPLQQGSTITIRELIDVVMVWSACAASVALGEALCGSEEAFVARMNEKAARLGIDAVFHDSYGGSQDNKISPYGVAKLSRYLILNHPQVLDVASKRSVTHRGAVYENSNRLLGEFTGIDGLKTGYTDAAGYCFVGTAQQGGRRIIAVTMGSTQTTRFPDTRILLNYGFNYAASIISEYQNSNLAMPSNANLILDGKEMPLTAYLIRGSHYFKLRDVAFLLRDTDSRFDVAWDQAGQAGLIFTGMSYTPVGGELTSLGDDDMKCIPTSIRFFCDGVEFATEVYQIEGNNYFMLRDLADMFGFDAEWIVTETRTIVLNTHTEYPEVEEPEVEEPGDEDGEDEEPGEEPGEVEEPGEEGAEGETMGQAA